MILTNTCFHSKIGAYYNCPLEPWDKKLLFHLSTIHCTISMDCVSIFQYFSIDLSSLPLHNQMHNKQQSRMEWEFSIHYMKCRNQHTQSAGSPEFPFMSLWFSSLVLPSLSLEVSGSKRDTPLRSSNSVKTAISQATKMIKPPQTKTRNKK